MEFLHLKPTIITLMDCSFDGRSTHCPPCLPHTVDYGADLLEPIVSRLVARNCCGVVVEVETAKKGLEMVNGHSC
jgi:hypothetical protein